METNNMNEDPNVNVAPVEGAQTPPESQEPQSNQPSPDSPRFNQVYGKLKWEERANDVLIEQVKTMAEQLKELKQAQQNFQFDSKAKQYEELMAAAVEQQDLEGFSKVMTAYKDNLMKRAPQTLPEVDSVEQRVNKNTNMFKKMNPWFETDPQMTQYAVMVNNQLKNDPKWGDPTQTTEFDFLAEVSRQTQMHFANVGYKPNYNVNAQTTGGTYSPDFAPPATPPAKEKHTTLTDVQKHVARRMFPGETAETAYKYYAENL